ncbi:MAG: glycoside hydrolase family 127 protein [Ardenticatenales bacterium]|nr:glycoside hydrolase family 127 protein [Ardenticatenales bacterium]
MANTSLDTIEALPFTAVSLGAGFWRDRVTTVVQRTIPFALQKCEETGRLDNFRKAAGQLDGSFRGDYGFDDSDVYKIIEGAAYALQLAPDPELDRYLDEIIAAIAGAQEADGYLYTAWTLQVNDERAIHCTYDSERGQFYGSHWSHELYNVGHLYEAAVAHHLATGKRNLLDVALKSADLVYQRCLVEGEPHYPGHQEIEIGLAKLYRLTGEARYLELAQLFLDRRGHGSRAYPNPNNTLHASAAYCQDHEPVTEQREAVGHAVRATYMYTAMADVAALTGNEAYVTAIDGIWQDMAARKLYITGGIGARYDAEAFGDAYELPHLAYAETCAAIANVYWNLRMFQRHGDARYIDLLERSLYNGVLAGLSLDGTEFFYPNPLSHDGQHGFNRGSGSRQTWFDCSCCPSNLARFVPSVAGYAYAYAGNHAYVNLFLSGTATLPLAGGQLQLAQRTDYPWSGAIDIEILANENEAPVALYLREPGWLSDRPVATDLYHYADGQQQQASVSLNGVPVTDVKREKGYLVLERHWQAGDTVQLQIPLSPRLVRSHEAVAANRGQVAVEMGPIVYCAEGVDHAGHALGLSLRQEAGWTVAYRPDLLSGVNVLQSEASPAPDRLGETIPLALIPYYAWAHRGAGEMTTWFHLVNGEKR